jgi:hypothetical protein
MPKRKQTPDGPRQSFSSRFDSLEHGRERLLERLALMGAHGESHPAYKRALALLNQTFRRASVAQRAAVLHSATWVIELIERSVGLL